MTHDNILNDVRLTLSMAVKQFEALGCSADFVDEYKQALTRLDAWLAAKTAIDADYRDVDWYKHGDALIKLYESELLLNEYNQRITDLVSSGTTEKTTK